MATLLYGNLSTKTASYAIEPGTIDLPKLVQGDNFTLAVRLTETANNATTVTRPTISTARLSYGPVDLAPTAGTFKIVVGGVTSGVVTIGSSAASVAAVLNAMATPATAWSVALDRDSYLVSRTDAWTATSGITITDNLLEPESFVRVTSYAQAGRFVQELRPMQSPLAYTSAFALIVPPAPTITRVVTGYSDAATGVAVNEVQRLYVHPQFDGVFQIYKGTARTQLLDKDDGAPEIQAALIAGCTTKGTDETFLVTNPRNNTADIEFSGGLGGAAQDLLTIVVPESLQGDVTFDLDLNTQGMLASLRDNFEITHPLTCEVGINYGTIATPNIKYVTVFQQNMTVQADGAWTGLAAAQRINWLNPPQPVNYIPFTTDQVITGIQSFTAVVTGNGPWTIAHNLGTEAIHVTVRENISNGYLLGNENDYTIQTATSQSIVASVVSPAVVPTAGWAVMISSAGPTSAFLAHTHTIDQIDTLRDTLNSLGQRVGDLENVLPNNAGVINQAGVDTTPLTITVPERAAVLFADVEGAWGGKGIERGKLPRRGPSLLRAISTATPVNSPVATVPTSAGVFLYSGGIELPPMGYIPGQTVPAGGAVAYEGDGRIYRVRQEPGKNTWFPVPYEVELFRIPVNSSQLRVGRTLTCNFGLTLQMLAETDAQWRIVIDAANLSGANSPADQGLNLTAADFNQVAMLDHRVLLTQALTPHIFGVQILRRLVDGNVQVSANRNLYGTLENAGGPPATGDFILRARLMNFDIAEDGGDVRGWVGYQLAGVQDNGVGGDIKVTIT